jgi:hypothetical protein
MKIIKIKQYQCLRCGHLWIPRFNQRPGVCPVCKRKDWDVKPTRRKAQGIHDHAEEIEAKIEGTK